jgi:hypothetical protein
VRQFYQRIRTRGRLAAIGPSKRIASNKRRKEGFDPTLSLGASLRFHGGELLSAISSLPDGRMIGRSGTRTRDPPTTLG